MTAPTPTSPHIFNMAERIIAPLRSEAEFKEIYLSLAESACLPYTADDTVSLFYGIYKNLVETSKFFNLTAITECAVVAERHIVDSALPAKLLCERGLLGDGDSLCDVGAGAGFPTLPLGALSATGAIPQIKLHAVDSTAKKVRYIEETAKLLGIRCVSGTAGRAEELACPAAGRKKAGPLRGRFDIVTARAVSALPVLVELCAPMLKLGGIFAAMKAHSDEEISAAARGAEKLGLRHLETVEYRLPSGDARSLVIYKKVNTTPGYFPRAYAKITAKPL